MQAIEQRLQQRYPHWFRGHRGRLAAPLLHGWASWSGLDGINAFCAEAEHAGLHGFAFVEAALRYLQLRYDVDEQTLARIPPQGPLLIVANHPCGGLDALALLDMVGRVRRDVRIVANEVLALVEPLAELLLPVRVFGGSAGAASLRRVERALRDGECVIVFPAGEVSRLGPGGVRDTRWRPGFLRFARRTSAPVLPVRIEARNSALFYGISALWRPASTALLAREMFARRQRPMRLYVGEALSLAQDEDEGAALKRIRHAVYASGRRPAAALAVAAVGRQPLAAAIDADVLARAMEATELLGCTGDGKQIRLARHAGGSPLLQEIGRLRELSFREVGEGTGRSRDLDAYDAHYDHILVWDAQASCIAGAYRVMRGAEALARSGLAGLYTASLFRYEDEAVPRLASGLELGRSFVVPDYWGSRSLDYLWQGIGAYLQRYPGVRYLYGAVSISAAMPHEASERIVDYYRRYYGSAQRLASARRPFVATGAPSAPDGQDDGNAAFDSLKAALARLGASVPMLYKQYTELCEPGGARFLAFGVDPDFSGAIDGLIEVDLECVRPRKRQRYLQARSVPA
ncbi:lysophospholipid acyltransferase family protein [Rhodanobacter sp. 7MK24]|uniref:lysophospholipid acyltransferase family protein n=1 Tax=Rhodanobacter sp. 7MK24 TaxID=2775922 RepID=UPI0017810EFC|nr:lysophospholipid acyltransferase family protein [Rhodanobacter sp. 7MK24]MBD8881516.1 lysophospholipid acyltransferase family protein [Rhodanobacter sp. 7MK24]